MEAGHGAGFAAPAAADGRRGRRLAACACCACARPLPPAAAAAAPASTPAALLQQRNCRQPLLTAAGPGNARWAPLPPQPAKRHHQSAQPGRRRPAPFQRRCRWAPARCGGRAEGRGGRGEGWLVANGGSLLGGAMQQGAQARQRHAPPLPHWPICPTWQRPPVPASGRHLRHTALDSSRTAPHSASPSSRCRCCRPAGMEGHRSEGAAWEPRQARAHACTRACLPAVFPTKALTALPAAGQRGSCSAPSIAGAAGRRS